LRAGIAVTLAGCVPLPVIVIAIVSSPLATSIVVAGPSCVIVIFMRSIPYQNGIEPGSFSEVAVGLAFCDRHAGLDRAGNYRACPAAFELFGRESWHALSAEGSLLPAVAAAFPNGSDCVLHA
jgi:hypothetical protein